MFQICLTNHVSDMDWRPHRLDHRIGMVYDLKVVFQAKIGRYPRSISARPGYSQSVRLCAIGRALAVLCHRRWGFGIVRALSKSRRFILVSCQILRRAGEISRLDIAFSLLDQVHQSEWKALRFRKLITSMVNMITPRSC
jgi:hypothetical protein